MANKPTRLSSENIRTARLYDATSRYISLADLTGLVEGGIATKALDANTGEDLAQNTLMHIFDWPRSAKGAPIFTADMLAKMISLYGSACKSVLGPTLGSLIKAFVARRRRNGQAGKLGAGGAAPRLGGGSALGRPVGQNFQNSRSRDGQNFRRLGAKASWNRDLYPKRRACRPRGLGSRLGNAAGIGAGVQHGANMRPVAAPVKANIPSVSFFLGSPRQRAQRSDGGNARRAIG